MIQKRLALLSLVMVILIIPACGAPQQEQAAVKTELASTQRQLEKLRADSTTQSITPAQPEESNAALQEQPGESQGELDHTLDTVVTQSYNFRYSRVDYSWTLDIPLRDYFYYKEKPRPTLFSEYALMATDPHDDYLINNLVRNLNEAAATLELNNHEKANFVVTFTRSLPYTQDIVTTSYDEYPRYPVETLLDLGGDCEDIAILATALLTEMGYDVALLLFKEQQHMAIGIDMSNMGGYYWEYRGKKYFYTATTVGLRIGFCPDEFQKALAHVYPVGD